jgi:exosome complex component CSL4
MTTHSASAAKPPTLRFPVGATLMPGDRLGTLRDVRPSVGTYVQQRGHVCASLVGRLALQQTKDETWLASVEAAGDGQEKASDRVLAEGQVVLCEVARIATQQAFVQILAVEGKKGTLEEWQRPEGSIRKEDIRTGASEQVLVQESFLPGDLVLARILSLGDTRRFILGTAEPQLGVLRAVSASSGRPMIPISWKEMECPETGAKEPRKCAKPRKLPDGA